MLSVLIVSLVECVSDVAGDCYTFSGTLFVFGDLATDIEAQEVVLPSIQRYIQGRSDWTEIDSRLLDVVYVISENGQIILPEPLPGTPTSSPTLAPTSMFPSFPFYFVKCCFFFQSNPLVN